MSVIFWLKRKLTAFWRLFADFFVPNYWGAAVVFFAVLAIVSMGGEGVGVSNLFRDVPEHHRDVWHSAIFTSPSAWTGVTLAFAVGLILMTPLFDWYYKQRNRRRINGLDLSTVLIIVAVAAQLILYSAWRNADGSDFLRGEHVRFWVGTLAGWMFVGAIWVLIRGFVRAMQVIGTQVADQPSLFSEADETLPLRLMQRRPFRNVITYVRNHPRAAATYYYYLPLLAALFVFLSMDRIMPGVALLLIVLFVFVFTYFVVHLKWSQRLVLIGVLAALFLVAFKGSDGGFKVTFDGINGPAGISQYDRTDALFDIEAPDSDEYRAMEAACVSDPGFAGGPVDMERSLANWHAVASQAQGRPDPKMVIIATSGGAYRAAFWTTLVMDQLIQSGTGDEQLDGIARSVRFITGASGGMVGAAYFAADAGPDGFTRDTTLTDMLTDDIKAAQLPDPDRPEALDAYYHLRAKPFPRDSLSALSRHIVRTDLPSLVTRGRVDVDRGKVLDKHWRTIDVPFGDLRAGEEAGWRPSILFSPMLVESSKPLVISNLRISEIPDATRGEIVEFHRAYPCARGSFSMATAARMNATFPYISPAVSLPSQPRRRVVDAGYYDNYGISLITAILGSDEGDCSRQALRAQQAQRQPFCFSQWMNDNTSGIVLIEIRAFRLGTSSESTEHCEDRPETGGASPFEFLTSPIDAVLSARGGTMVLRNEQVLRHYADGTDAVPLRRLVLVNCVSGGMSWIMPKDELDQMQSQFADLWSKARQYPWSKAPGVGKTAQAGIGQLTAQEFLQRAWAE
ncbi:hypothetical protein [Tateyamaria sp. SN6-1]|uniref:hypothetical protein n=1 Tax=Tateyamaria sp. SN6-1 TaxID=3092148 RepID=UPI0039F4953B